MTAQIDSDPLDTLHDSCSGVFGLLPTQPRSVPRIQEGGPFHSSALKRHDDPPIHQCPYRYLRDHSPDMPATLDIFAAQEWNDTGIWLEADAQYGFNSSGEWMDASIKCTPGGAEEGKLQPGEIAYLVGDALGKAEEWFKRVTQNNEADFRFTRRHEDMPWFCLVGAIANGGGVDAKDHLQPHEAFAIDTGCTYVPLKSGYFYAYANDAWNAYRNNRGG
jgi:hypothetical protein